MAQIVPHTQYGTSMRQDVAECRTHASWGALNPCGSCGIALAKSRIDAGIVAELLPGDGQSQCQHRDRAEDGRIGGNGGDPRTARCCNFLRGAKPATYTFPALTDVLFAAAGATQRFSGCRAQMKTSVSEDLIEPHSDERAEV